MAANLSTEQQQIADWVEENKEEYYQLADTIWSYAELGMEEQRSSKALINYLKKAGFTVIPGVAEMPTAFVATAGSGKPVIAFSAEYDALPGLSQQRNSYEHQPLVEGAPGQGCGHNLLGVGAVMAATALKSVMEKLNLSGTIKVWGTPAEEICVGKPFMAKAGIFNNTDAVLDWHPLRSNAANYTACNAYFSIRYHFNGRTAHGNSPWYGRSALDAATLMGIMIEYLRENISPGNPPFAANTVNYSFPDVGPAFPVVVPDKATLWCVGRIVTSEEAAYVIQRLEKCARAAALATETEVTTELISATHERIPNKTLSAVQHRNLEAFGAPAFNEEEHAFVKKMQQDLGVNTTGLPTSIQPLAGGSDGVSDNSEYSWFAPFSMLLVTAGPDNIGWHNWQVATCVGGSIGRKALDTAIKVLAGSGVDLLQHPEIISEAKRELTEQLGGKSYHSFIPDTVKPPVNINQNIMKKYRPLQEKFYEEP